MHLEIVSNGKMVKRLPMKSKGLPLHEAIVPLGFNAKIAVRYESHRKTITLEIKTTP